MNDLACVVSMPFKRKGKDILKESDFVLSLSIDLNWFAPEQAKIILSEAEKEGLLKREGELVRAAFDISSVEIPQGFKPGKDILEKKTLFSRIIDRIIARTGMEKRKVIALVNKRHEELAKMVFIEVSAILVAMENGIAVDDLVEEEFESLTTLSSS